MAPPISPLSYDFSHRFADSDPSLDDLPSGQSFVILAPVSQRGSLKGISPFKLKRELDALIGTCVTAKVIRSGSLLLRARDRAQAKLALDISVFLGVEVKATLASRLNSTPGSVYAPSLLSMSETEIQQELRPQGVTSVVRLRSRGDRPNPRLKVFFLGLTIPPAIYAGYEILEVQPWEMNPRLCRQCGRYGHLQNTCRSRERNCVSCSSIGHTADECQRDEIRCGHCGGPHPAYEKTCPVWIEKKELLKKKNLPPPIPPPHFTVGACDPTPAETYAKVAASPARRPARPAVPRPVAARREALSREEPRSAAPGALSTPPREADPRPAPSPSESSSPQSVDTGRSESTEPPESISRADSTDTIAVPVTSPAHVPDTVVGAPQPAAPEHVAKPPVSAEPTHDDPEEVASCRSPPTVEPTGRSRSSHGSRPGAFD